MNWADSKLSVNSVNPENESGDTEPSHRNAREGVETGHGANHKVCSKCNQEKPVSEFYRKDVRDRLDSTCKACRITAQREKILGVTDADYWKMYREQGGKCGICQRRLYSKRYKAFCVDHSHATGEIRGLLCHNCNRAIGMLGDSSVALRRAAEWVEGTVRSSK